MKFIDLHINRVNRFSLGQEQESGTYYLSIPVSNRHVDYEEYYEIVEAVFSKYPENEAELIEFANDCRRRKHDKLLLVKPGKDRGVG